MDGLPDGAFWRFSLDFYGRPEVADACIALQDREDADVNLVLLGLWLGICGHRLSVGKGRRLARLARDWQEPIVAPLRRVRRRLKQRSDLPWPAPLAAWRNDLARVELGLEQVEQLLLEAAVGPVEPAVPDPLTVHVNLAALGLARLLESTEMQTLLRIAADTGLSAA